MPLRDVRLAEAFRLSEETFSTIFDVWGMYREESLVSTNFVTRTACRTLAGRSIGDANRGLCRYRFHRAIQHHAQRLGLIGRRLHSNRQRVAWLGAGQQWRCRRHGKLDDLSSSDPAALDHGALLGSGGRERAPGARAR